MSSTLQLRSASHTARLTTSESLALDVIRVAAACVVAFGHITQPPFSTGWPDLTYLAQSSVAVFFLLSGFVIRYVTYRRPATLGHYFGDRASRIYSIAIPALLFTFIADAISSHVGPGYHIPWPAFCKEAFFSIGVNLVFCGKLWTHTIFPLSNSPFWSVNYEVAYYLLYGCWFYLSGARRWLSIAAISLFFGPRVLYLAPLWILGCLLHDFYQQTNRTPTAITRTSRIALSIFALLTAFFAVFVTLIQRGYAFGNGPFMRISGSAGIPPANYLFGLLWAIAFFALLKLARPITLQPDTAFSHSIHFIAEGTFPIYLLHLPYFYLIAAVIPYNHANPLPKLIIFASILLIGVLAGHPGNLLKIKIRSLIFQS